jgi:hypothetical protein
MSRQLLVPAVDDSCFLEPVTMKQHTTNNDSLSQITPEVDELCNILAQAIERINGEKNANTKKKQ